MLVHIYLSIYLSIYHYLSIYLSIYLSSDLSIYASIQASTSVFGSISSSTCLSCNHAGCIKKKLVPWRKKMATGKDLAPKTLTSWRPLLPLATFKVQSLSRFSKNDFNLSSKPCSNNVCGIYINQQRTIETKTSISAFTYQTLFFRKLEHDWTIIHLLLHGWNPPLSVPCIGAQDVSNDLPRLILALGRRWGSHSWIRNNIERH